MTVLYRLYSPDNELLYVGISINPSIRFHQHAADKPWWNDTTRIHLEHHPDRPTALQAERQAILTEKPRHNIIHNGPRPQGPPIERVPMATDDRTDRLTQAATTTLRPDSLVGSFFHSGADPGWQGCVIAEPNPGTYLVELFDWLVGASTHQTLIQLEQMADWQFYDTAEWMNNTYQHGLGDRWELQRNGQTK